MASIENVILNDDLDPRISTGVETVTFFDPFTGEKREIELGEANRKHFANHLEKLRKYVDSSRVVEAPKAAKAAPKASGETALIRAWAKAQGLEVGDRGRIKPEIVEAYRKAQATEVPDAEVVGYVQHPEVNAEAPVEPEATPEVAETENEAPEQTEAAEVKSENDEFREFLMAHMDENGQISAASLANAENI